MAHQTRVGDFYIQQDNQDFWLYKAVAGIPQWVRLGNIRDSVNIVGLWTTPLFPYTDMQQFGLAPGDRAVSYDPVFSAARSSVTCANRPTADVVVSFTDDLAAFLGYGERLICSAAFAAGSDVADLTFNTITVPGGRALWAIMPAVADPVFAGVQALIGGQG